jgi:alkanesulfonate monooxygenase SsuD/methylene tetrahydromethanopterin reductase-like flavin-dependent oxidoreductase (luciferase family)
MSFMARTCNHTNPMFGPDPFKIGVFGYLHFGGGAYTRAPERWQANWDDIVAMARIADDAKMDFLLPIARWKGVKGKEKQRLKSYETLSHAAALAGLTKHIALFATCHVPIVPPVFAAKSLVTIDHASHGRAGVNIVCGWNQDDFDMFGFTQLDHDDRYEQGQEWYDVLTRIVGADGEEEFDFNGRYFKLKNVIGRPPSVQQPRPCTLSAAYSPAGRAYAARTSDFLLTSLVDYEQGAGVVLDMKKHVAEAGTEDVFKGVVAVSYVVCRETDREAEEFHRYYAETMADNEAVDQYISDKQGKSMMAMREIRMRWAGGNGGYPLVGSPERIVDEMVKIQKLGFAGTTIKLCNYLDEFPFFVQRVMPLMKQAGLRIGEQTLAAATA